MAALLIDTTPNFIRRRRVAVENRAAFLPKELTRQVGWSMKQVSARGTFALELLVGDDGDPFAAIGTHVASRGRFLLVLAGTITGLDL
jgi:hypothetical protein